MDKAFKVGLLICSVAFAAILILGFSQGAQGQEPNWLKLIYTDTAPQTGHIVLTQMAGQLHNERIIITHQSMIDPNSDHYNPGRHYGCVQNITGSDWCVPHKDSIYHMSSPRTVFWGTSFEPDGNRDNMHFVEVTIYGPDEICKKQNIVVVPPAGSGAKSFSAYHSNCVYNVWNLDLTGVWTWYLEGVPEINGSVTVIDMHAVIKPYLKYGS